MNRQGKGNKITARISRRITDSGVCLLTFDHPASSANVLDRETLEALQEHLDFLESERACKRLVLRSAKNGIFIAGADLKVFQSDYSEEAIFDFLKLGQETFKRLARLPQTTVAAIHGACLGGGLELALACDYRIASSHRLTEIGFPEVQLGLLPAWGGCTRLPRRIGFLKALTVIPTAKIHGSETALKLGLIDKIVYPEKLFEAASAMSLLPKRTAATSFPFNGRVLSGFLARRARNRILRATHGSYPAPLKALEVMRHGLRGTVEASLERERSAFVELSKTEVSRNLVALFFLQQRAKKLQIEGAGKGGSHGSPGKFEKAAVLGAGIMGAGIAQWLGSRRMRVLLKDVNNEQLCLGMRTAKGLFEEGVKRKIFTRLEARDGLDRIQPLCEDLPHLAVDIVIEAVGEEVNLKKTVFRRLEAQTAPNTLLATNTSALSITEIAKGLQRPQNVLGIHFFNPVRRMKLVEIIRGEKTGADTLRRALAFVKKIGKLPVVVRDSPGFLVNRILTPYLMEGVRLFEEGYSVGEVDKPMVRFGMPMGPLRLLDEVGLEVARHVAENQGERLPNASARTGLLDRMLELGWMGRKSGNGFYRYERGRNRVRENPELGQLRRPRDRGGRNDRLLADRMILAMVNEAARCLEESIVGAPEDIDFAMIMGTGWAPFRGGPLRYADCTGPARLARKLETMGKTVSNRFQPCALLREMALRGQNFYPSRRLLSQPERRKKAEPFATTKKGVL